LPGRKTIVPSQPIHFILVYQRLKVLLYQKPRGDLLFDGIPEDGLWINSLLLFWPSRSMRPSPPAPHRAP
jgi:hypothetical protein